MISFLVVWGCSSETYTAVTPQAISQVYHKKSPKANHPVLIMLGYITDMKTPMQMLTIKNSVHNTTERIKAVYEAADWMHHMGMLVPCSVFFDARMTRSFGRYFSFQNLIKIQPLYYGSTEDIQATVVHELVHAYQNANGLLHAKKVGTIKKMSQFESYLLQPIEIEAFWWENEFMKQVHGKQGHNVKHYIRLGVKEFM